MRFLIFVLGVVIAIAVSLYVVLFTPIGNSFVKPFIERKINQELFLDGKLTTFLLNMSTFELSYETPAKNIVNTKGEYELFKKNFRADYNIELNNLEELKEFLQTPLRGNLKTRGEAKGNLKDIYIQGIGDIANSKAVYKIILSDLNPTSIIIKSQNTDLAQLLYMLSQDPYARGDVDINIDFKNITPHKLDGNVNILSKNSYIESQGLSNKFEIKLDAKLQNDDVIYSCNVGSNLFKIISKGIFTPEPLKVDLSYLVDIKNLEALNPITKQDLRGAFSIEGVAKGDRENLILEAKSDIASSKTAFRATMQDLTLKSLETSIKHLELKKLLYMLKKTGQPDGEVSLDAKISTAIDKDLAKSTIAIDSSLAKFSAKEFIYNLNDSSIKSDYSLDISALENIYFLTQKKLRGSLTLKGEIKKSKDLEIYINAPSINTTATLYNDDFNADIKSTNSTKILYMLYYPQILDATLNAKIAYNLSKNSGDVKLNIKEGVFADNKTFNMLKQYTNIDMYKDKFDGDANAKLLKEQIFANINLTSTNSSIKANDAKINTKTKQLDSDLTLSSKKDSFSVHLSGDMDAPKISIDLEKFLESQSGKKAIQKVDNLLNKLFNK